MRRLTSLLSASLALASLFFIPAPPAGACTDVCVGVGSATLGDAALTVGGVVPETDTVQFTFVEPTGPACLHSCSIRNVEAAAPTLLGATDCTTASCPSNRPVEGIPLGFSGTGLLIGGMAMLSVSTVATRLGVSDQTIRNWCRAGLIPVIRPAGRKWLIPADDFERWLERGGQAAGQFLSGHRDDRSEDALLTEAAAFDTGLDEPVSSPADLPSEVKTPRAPARPASSRRSSA